MIDIREEIDTTLYKISKDFEKRLLKEFYPSAKDDVEMEEIKEKAKSYFRVAILSAYFRYKAKKLGKEGVIEMEYIYDEASHEFDEIVDYKTSPEFPDCWIFHISDFNHALYNTNTEYRDAMKVLVKKIRSHCITHKSYYIIKRDTLSDILENFYKEPRKNID